MTKMALGGMGGFRGGMGGRGMGGMGGMGGFRGGMPAPQVLPTRPTTPPSTGTMSPRPTVSGAPAPDYGTMNQRTALKKGGKVSSASSRADGCAVRGKTKGKMI